MRASEGRWMIKWPRLLLTGGALSAIGCGGGTSSPQTTPPTGPVTLGQSSAYLGTARSSCAANCLRAPGTGGNDVVVSQPGNVSNFQAVSSDPSVVTGAAIMIVGFTQSEPGIELIGQKAGTTSVTILGNNGSAAQLPVTVTTVSTMTIAVNGLPTAAGIQASVATPSSPDCSGFNAGYFFDLDVPTPPATNITYSNWPAMADGPSSACIYSTIVLTVRDNAGNTLAQKTTHVPISLGKDNPLAIALP